MQSSDTSFSALAAETEPPLEGRGRACFNPLWNLAREFKTRKKTNDTFCRISLQENYNWLFVNDCDYEGITSFLTKGALLGYSTIFSRTSLTPERMDRIITFLLNDFFSVFAEHQVDYLKGQICNGLYGFNQTHSRINEDGNEGFTGHIMGDCGGRWIGSPKIHIMLYNLAATTMVLSNESDIRFNWLLFAHLLAIETMLATGSYIIFSFERKEKDLGQVRQMYADIANYSGIALNVYHPRYDIVSPPNPDSAFTPRRKKEHVSNRHMLFAITHTGLSRYYKSSEFEALDLKLPFSI